MARLKIPDESLASNTTFAGGIAEVQATNPVALGSDRINVLVDGRWVTYRRLTGATDLRGGDGSAWKIADVTIDDLTALAGDLTTLFTSLPVSSGIWQPSLAWSGGGGSFTYTKREGEFYRVGQRVDLRANIDVTVNAGGLNNLQLIGLPFPTKVGSFANWLDVCLDSFFFQGPYGSSNFKIRFSGGQTSGPFSYDTGANYAGIYCNTLSAVPLGDGSTVTLGATGKTAQIVGFEAETGTTGMVKLSRRFAEITNGMTLTHASWTGIVDLSKSWFGAPSQTTFLDQALVTRGEPINLEISGSILI